MKCLMSHKRVFKLFIIFFYILLLNFSVFSQKITIDNVFGINIGDNISAYENVINEMDNKYLSENRIGRLPIFNYYFLDFYKININDNKFYIPSDYNLGALLEIVSNKESGEIVKIEAYIRTDISISNFQTMFLDDMKNEVDFLWFGETKIALVKYIAPNGNSYFVVGKEGINNSLMYHDYKIKAVMESPKYKSIIDAWKDGEIH